MLQYIYPYYNYIPSHPAYQSEQTPAEKPPTIRRGEGGEAWTGGPLWSPAVARLNNWLVTEQATITVQPPDTRVPLFGTQEPLVTVSGLLIGSFFSCILHST